MLASVVAFASRRSRAGTDLAPGEEALSTRVKKPLGESMPQLIRFVAAALLLPLLTSCGVPIRYAGGFAPGAEVVPPLSFSWNQDADRSGGDPRLENNQFFEERLHEAIEWELSMRGIRSTDAPPDLLIHHHLSLVDHEMVEEIIEASGESRTELYSYEEATVMVHVVDARTGRDLWVGWAQGNVEPALRGPEAMRAWVYEVVSRIFRSWPVIERSTN
jgi:hypothetical protein